MRRHPQAGSDSRKPPGFPSRPERRVGCSFVAQVVVRARVARARSRLWRSMGCVTDAESVAAALPSMIVRDRESDYRFARRVRGLLYAKRGPGSHRLSDIDAARGVAARQLLRSSLGWSGAERERRSDELREAMTLLRSLEAECLPVSQRSGPEREFSRRTAQRRWKRLQGTDWWPVVVELGIVSLGSDRLESLRALFEAARSEVS